MSRRRKIWTQLTRIMQSVLADNDKTVSVMHGSIAATLWCMKTEELITQFVANHREAAAYICGLPEAEFIHSYNGKWTAGQQLLHLVLCVQPIAKALAAKEYIREKFGVQQREGMSYEQVLATYKEGLQKGGKAPERFLPEVVGYAQRQELAAEMETLLTTIQNLLGGYTETELDTLVMPHPFLGMLSIREMLGLMSYHPVHHMQQVRGYLGVSK